jgi:opacity protein-like surface antigen
MRMLRLVIAVSLVLAFAAPAMAASVGSPAGLVAKGKWTLSLSGDYLIEQKFKDYDLKRTSSAGASDVERKSAKFEEDQTYLATLAWGATDWLNIFAQAGWARGGKWIDKDIDTGQEWEAKLKDQFVWGLGIKASVWQPRPGWDLLLTGRYYRYDDRKADDWQNNTQGFPANQYWNTDDKLDYWQVDLNALIHITHGNLFVYAGAGWSYAEADLSGRWTAPGAWVDYDSTMKLKDQINIPCGIGYQFTPNLSAMLSGEFWSRTLVGLSVSWTF